MTHDWRWNPFSGEWEGIKTPLGSSKQTKGPLPVGILSLLRRPVAFPLLSTTAITNDHDLSLKGPSAWPTLQMVSGLGVRVDWILVPSLFLDCSQAIRRVSFLFSMRGGQIPHPSCVDHYHKDLTHSKRIPPSESPSSLGFFFFFCSLQSNFIVLRLERLYSIFASNFKIKENIRSLGETNKQTSQTLSLMERYSIAFL